MKVLHVETGRHVYGGARQVLALLGGLRDLGVEGILACANGSEVAAAARRAGESPATLPVRGDADLLMLPRLRRLIARQRPDLVHLHSRRGADLWGVLAARLAGVPAVLTRRVDNPPGWLTRRIGLASSARVIVVSGGIREVLLDAGVPAGRLACVYDAVAAADFDEPYPRDWFRQHFAAPVRAPLVGVVAQLIPRKGHRVLLDALPAVMARLPDARVLCFGRGPLAAELRAAIAQRGLGQSMVLAGFRDDMHRVIGGLDVLVHPALAEGLGVALLEAGAARVPVIASAAGGIPEVVLDGETGLLVPPGDPAALSAAMLRLLGDPALAARLGAAARVRVETHFSVAAMAAGNLAVYRHVLGAPRGPGA